MIGDENKYDGEKIRLDLVEPSLIEAIGKIRTYGVKKYTDEQSWKKVATNISPSSGGGHSSGVSDKVGTAVAKIATLEQEINTEIDELIRVKAEIEHTISAVADERLRLILIARYINCNRWEQIAVMQNIELRWLYRLHGRALSEISKIIDH